MNNNAKISISAGNRKLGKGYQSPAEFNVIDCTAYRAEAWRQIEDDASWCPQLVIY